MCRQAPFLRCGGAAAVVVLAILFLATTAEAEWSHNIYENNPVSISDTDDQEPVVVSDGSGGVIVVWKMEREPDTDLLDLQAQRLDADGDPLWGPDGVQIWMSGSGNIHSFAAVADGSGGAFVVISDFVSTYFRAFAQWVNDEGSLTWGGVGVELSPDHWVADQIYVRLVRAADGSGLVAGWMEYGYDPPTDWDIWTQKVTTAGTVAWNPGGELVCGADDTQNEIAMAPDGAGGAFIAWVDQRDGGFLYNDIYAMHVDDTGAMTWLTDGMLIAGPTGQQTDVQAVPDGTGGVIFGWEDDAAGDDDIWLGRCTVLGDTWWTVQVSSETTIDREPRLAADGLGGAFVVWEDYRDDGYNGNDLYAQWVDQAGSLRWSSTGVRVGAADVSQYDQCILADGYGGAIVAWTDDRAAAGIQQPYAQRISGTGYRQWGTYGLQLSGASGDVDCLGAVTDGRGGVIAGWEDWRVGYWTDIYAQRVEYFGYLGDPSPTITGVTDYPQDQGGVVRLDWARSYLDDYPYGQVGQYSIWRRYGGPAAKAGAPTGEDVAARAAAVAARTGLPEEFVIGQIRSGWAYEAEVEAWYQPEYTYHAPTYADSTEAGIILTDYKVMAHAGGEFWESAVESGYSVDNLAPGAPLALAADPVGAEVTLSWLASGHHDEDLSHYNLFRSLTSGFEPGPDTFLHATTDTTSLDVIPGAGPYYYLVTAVDVHGNEGDASNEAEVTTPTGLPDDGPPVKLALRGNYPNPFNPKTTIHFDLPGARTVKLSVFALTGRRVVTLVDGELPAGRHQVDWSGRDEAGRAQASGVYIARLEAGGEQRSSRMMLIK